MVVIISDAAHLVAPGSDSPPYWLYALVIHCLFDVPLLSVLSNALRKPCSVEFFSSKEVYWKKCIHDLIDRLDTGVTCVDLRIYQIPAFPFHRTLSIEEIFAKTWP